MASELSSGDAVHISVCDLRKSYDATEVLRGVTFDVLRGKINMLIGGSGAGKSVFTRQLLRLERPDSGQIVVDGEDIATLSEFRMTKIRRKFGMVFQFGALFDSMSVFDNVAFPLREHTDMSQREVRERVQERLATLGVLDAAGKLPGKISGGMQKRVAIARALALEPEVLVYDEPTSGLDPVTSRKVDDLIQETSQRFGVTSLVISHDMSSVFRVGDQVSLLHQGRIEASGTPSVLLQSENAVVVEFLRSSGVRAPAQ